MNKIRNIVIYGAGMMGKGIAMALSLCDYSLTLFDVVQADILGQIKDDFRLLVDKGILTNEEVENRLSRMRFITDIKQKEIKNADMVIECVFEDMAIKQNVFLKLESICREDCIFCTNTSVMSPTEISSKIKHKERFVGTHFWNPAYLIPLVEVVKTENTDDNVAEEVIKVLQDSGKKAVLCKKDVPGFIANRMQHALWREAISIIENDIADAETVDIAVKNSFGLRLPQLPPIENIDMVGLDLTWNIHSYILPHLEDAHEPSKLLGKMLNRGENGYKTGRGFFKRTPEEILKQKEDLRNYLIKMIFNK